MFGQRISRRGAGLLLVVLVAVLPPALALLDAGEAGYEVRVESRHDPSQCDYAHDHTACLQLQHTRAVPFAAWAVPAPGGGGPAAARRPDDAPRRLLSGPALGPRAPPLPL